MLYSVRRWWRVHILKIGGVTHAHGGIALDN